MGWSIRKTSVAIGGFCLALCLLGALANRSLHAQTWLESIDYPRLIAEYGAIEDGTGIPLSIVEADVTNDDPNLLISYLPDAASLGLVGKNIIDGSGINNNGPSGHATGQARLIFGDNSIAQGETDITAFEANDYVNRVLGFSTGLDPLLQPFRVQNHSWIGNFGTLPAEIAAAEDTLARLDYAINRDNISVAVGLNNGTSAHPQLLGQSYNAIAVGRTDGIHSRGLTSVYGSGRVKPDIVTRESSTSAATSRVSSVLAVLHHKAVNEGNPDASRAVMIKSILMAGATKDEFPGWSRTTTRPLDTVFGAGEMNLYNSYKILEAGETDGSLSVPAGKTIETVGYDYGESIDPGSPLYYNMEVGAGGLEDLSVMLNWNIEVTDSNPDINLFDPQTMLANMSLRLYDSSVSPLGTLLDSSLSPVDNVEHIYLSSLGQGRYTIEVSTDISTTFGLSWFAVPEPGSLALPGFASLAVALRRRRRLS